MATTSFRLMGFNILGVRFSSKVSWLLRRPRIVKRASRVFNDVDTDFASIYTFLECRQYEADYLKAELGWTDSLSSPLGCTIGIRGGWKFGKHWVVPIDTAHDALIAEVTRDGVTVNVIAAHLPPFNTAAAHKARQAAFRKVSNFMYGWKDPSVWYLDANWRDTFEAFAQSLGWTSTRTNAKVKLRANYRTNGPFKAGKNIDYVLVRNGSGVSVGSYRVLEGWGSDHHSITNQLVASR